MIRSLKKPIAELNKSASSLLELCRPDSSSKPQSDVVIKPFLKWAGRKTKLVSTIKSLLPNDSQRFIEPFVGSGAVFINTHYSSSILSDTNTDIINLFEILRKDKKAFINLCQKLFIPHNNTEESYNALRDEFNLTGNRKRRATLFVYLNRHCFNGLCRYNKSGRFNTPFGKYDKPYFPRAEMLAFAEKLETATLVSQDFRQSLAVAGAGDVVYCDPPYVPLSSTASFTTYASGGFGPKDQEDLADSCYQAAKRGAIVLISNHDTPFTRKLYKRASKMVSVLVSRTISCDGKNRKKVKELIAIFDEQI